jgi:hypothetical protein
MGGGGGAEKGGGGDSRGDVNYQPCRRQTTNIFPGLPHTHLLPHREGGDSGIERSGRLENCPAQNLNVLEKAVTVFAGPKQLEAINNRSFALATQFDLF